MFEPDAPADALPVSSLWPPPKQKRQRQRSLAEVDKFHGVAHTNPTSYFCGCGWSFWFTLDFPCLSADLDDRVFMTKSEFVATTTTEPKASLQLPICTLQHERIGEPTNGRWVRDSWPNSTVCPFPYEVGKLASKSFPLTKFDDLYPSCWNREDISKVGSDCMEMNCALIDKSTEWHSHLHKDKEFYGVWRPYDCHYVQYTTPQLQECVTKRKIVKFEKNGASIAEFLSEFVNHRLANITMYPDASDPNALTVVYDTLGLLHKSGPNVLVDAVTSLPVVPANEERYWISSFFLSSERETVRSA
jgi:hypothetical protein